MELVARKKKLILYCKYSERNFPIALKGRWDNQAKAWSFHPSLLTYKRIVERAREQELELNIDERIKDHFRAKLKAADDFKRTQEFKTTPYKHQDAITDLILSKRRSFIFAGVGTGKSKGAIDATSIFHNNGEVNKCLVISPAGIMSNFSNEIKIHSYLESTIIYGSLTKRRELLKDSDTTFDIINYEVLDKLEKDIVNKKYDMVIIDEIHYCKNRMSNRSKAAYRVCKDIPIRVGLTGTIISNSYEDLFMPYKIIDESIFGTAYTHFKERYFRMGGYMNYKVVGYDHESELKKVIATNSIKFDIRDVIDLPPEVIIKKEVQLSNKALAIYKKAKDEMMVEFADVERPVFSTLERLLVLSQITSGFTKDMDGNIVEFGNEKLEVLANLLDEIDGKVAVFCRFRHSIDKVAKKCKELGHRYMIFDGRTKEKDSYKIFNEDDTKVWIAQLQKGEGYSIPVAKYAIFYELNYSRKDHVQCKGRNLRASGSEEGSCFYIYLLAKDTIDEPLYSILKEKDFTSKNALEYVKGVK